MSENIYVLYKLNTSDDEGVTSKLFQTIALSPNNYLICQNSPLLQSVSSFMQPVDQKEALMELLLSKSNHTQTIRLEKVDIKSSMKIIEEFTDKVQDLEKEVEELKNKNKKLNMEVMKKDYKIREMEGEKKRKEEEEKRKEEEEKRNEEEKREEDMLRRRGEEKRKEEEKREEEKKREEDMLIRWKEMLRREEEICTREEEISRREEDISRREEDISRREDMNSMDKTLNDSKHLHNDPIAPSLVSSLDHSISFQKELDIHTADLKTGNMVMYIYNGLNKRHVPLLTSMKKVNSYPIIRSNKRMVLAKIEEDKANAVLEIDFKGGCPKLLNEMFEDYVGGLIVE